MEGIAMPDQRRDPRSRLKRLIDQSNGGVGIPGQVEACPFGCGQPEMNELGYCKHLVGFCNHTNLPDGTVRDPQGAVIELLEENDARGGHGRIVGPRREPLKVGDYVLRITQSYRVYRDVDAKPAGKPETKLGVERLDG